MKSEKSTLLPSGARSRNARVIVVALSAALTALVIYHLWIAYTWYRAFRLFTHDVGQIDFWLLHTLWGRFFWSIVTDCPHFAVHFTPTLALFVPGRTIFQHVLYLPFMETILLFSGAWAVAWMTDGMLRRGGRRPRGLSPLALALGWFYAGNTLTGSIALSWHFESIAVGLTLWALAALANQRWRLFWPLMLLSLGCKEDMAVLWALFGAWWMVFGRHGSPLASRPRRAENRQSKSGLFHRIFFKPGAVMILLSAAFTLASVLTIANLRSKWGALPPVFADRYNWLGDSPGERVWNFISHWRTWILPLWMVFSTLLPAMLFLPLFAPSLLLVLVPQAYLMGLSSVDSLQKLYYYYSYPFLPFLFLGAAIGVARIARVCRKLPGRKRWRAALGAGLFVAGCVCLILPTLVEGRRRVPLEWTQRQDWVHAQLNLKIPPDSSVAAQFDLFCQIKPRERMYALSAENADRAEYWAIDMMGFPGDQTGRQMNDIIERGNSLIREGRAKVVLNQNGLLIIHQMNPPKGPPWRK